MLEPLIKYIYKLFDKYPYHYSDSFILNIVKEHISEQDLNINVDDNENEALAEIAILRQEWEWVHNEVQE